MNESSNPAGDLETNPSEPHPHIKMDYTLPTAEERKAKVEEILASTPSERLSSQYLHKLAKYIVEPITKEEKKENDKKILTDNRMKTVNTREVSFEGIVGKMETGEDGIYNLITDDKNIIFYRKSSITEEDLEDIPPLKQLCQDIVQIKSQIKKSRGRKAYLLGQQLIEMYKDQYVIKDAYKPTIKMHKVNLIKTLPQLNLDEHITIYRKKQLEVSSDSLINLYDKNHISILLCNYSKLKEDSWDKFQSDIHWLMEDLDNLIDLTFAEKYPMYLDLLIYKIDGRTNAEIQELLEKDYGVKHSVEYLSALWRNKIPKMIAETAKDEYLIWYYSTQKYGKWKKCTRCGQVKLACNRFFSKNSASKDGFYSICKQCRNKKPNQKKII